MNYWKNAVKMAVLLALPMSVWAQQPSQACQEAGPLSIGSLSRTCATTKAMPGAKSTQKGAAAQAVSLPSGKAQAVALPASIGGAYFDQSASYGDLKDAPAFAFPVAGPPGSSGDREGSGFGGERRGPPGSDRRGPPGSGGDQGERRGPPGSDGNKGGDDGRSTPSPARPTPIWPSSYPAPAPNWWNTTEWDHYGWWDYLPSNHQNPYYEEGCIKDTSRRTCFYYSPWLIWSEQFYGRWHSVRDTDSADIVRDQNNENSEQRARLTTTFYRDAKQCYYRAVYRYDYVDGGRSGSHWSERFQEWEAHCLRSPRDERTNEVRVSMSFDMGGESFLPGEREVIHIYLRGDRLRYDFTDTVFQYQAQTLSRSDNHERLRLIANGRVHPLPAWPRTSDVQPPSQDVMQARWQNAAAAPSTGQGAHAINNNSIVYRTGWTRWPEPFYYDWNWSVDGKTFTRNESNLTQAQSATLESRTYQDSRVCFYQGVYRYDYRGGWDRRFDDYDVYCQSQPRNYGNSRKKTVTVQFDMQGQKLLPWDRSRGENIGVRFDGSNVTYDASDAIFKYTQSSVSKSAGQETVKFTATGRALFEAPEADKVSATLSNNGGRLELAIADRRAQYYAGETLRVHVRVVKQTRVQVQESCGLIFKCKNDKDLERTVYDQAIDIVVNGITVSEPQKVVDLSSMAKADPAIPAKAKLLRTYSSTVVIKDWSFQRVNSKLSSGEFVRRGQGNQVAY